MEPENLYSNRLSSDVNTAGTGTFLEVVLSLYSLTHKLSRVLYLSSCYD